jgi:anti-sigma regulatory factor (Ser/Thr protein kinase)/ActR/RegA family two-component response regulator
MEQACQGQVLLIGLDDTTAQGLAHSPDLQGCSFQIASGEADGLRRIRRVCFDLVITSPATTIDEDLALVDEIRRIRRSVKVILLAPQTTPAGVIAALRAHVFAVFGAPYDLEEIAPMARQAIDAVDWRDGIEVLSARPNWLSLRVASHRLTAERLVAFLNELPSELEEAERDRVLLAFREILLNAMEHGAGFDSDQLVEVSAVHTERAIVFYVHDPGPGFTPEALDHAAVGNPEDDPLAHSARRAELGLRPGGFGILVAKKIVDELIYNESGNAVLMIKHTT